MPGRAPGAATRSESEEVAESPARPDQTRRHARLRAAGRRASRSSFATDSLSVAGWTAISRITGFGRAGAIAAVLGPSYLGNIFAATNILPNLAYSLLAGALFSNLLVPPLVRLLDADDRSGAERLAGAFLGSVLLAFGAVALVLVLAGPFVLGLLTLSVPDPAVAAAQREAGIALLALVMPQLLLYATAATGEAVMHARGRFALPAAAPALENLGVMVTLAVTAAVYGTGGDLSGDDRGALRLLGLGATASVGLHAAAQWWGAQRVGIRLRPRWGWREPEVRRILRRAVPSLGYSGLDVALWLGALVVANRVPGGVIAWLLALNFYALPSALGPRPVAVSLLPRLSRLFHENRWQAFRDELVRGASLTAFLVVPAAVAYATVARPLARAVTFGQMATPSGVTLVAACLASLALAVVGAAAMLLGTYASYARQDARSPFRAMVVRVAVAAVGMGLTLAVIDGTAVLIALGLTVSLAELAGGLYLARRLRRKLPQGGSRLTPAVLRAGVASLVMAVPAYVVATRLPRVLANQWQDQLSVAAAAIVGLCVFLGVQRVLRSPELSLLLGGFREFRSPPSKG